jgi:hypothetical protein
VTRKMIFFKKYLNPMGLCPCPYVHWLGYRHNRQSEDRKTRFERLCSSQFYLVSPEVQLILLIFSSESSPQYLVTAVCRSAKFLESLALLRKSVVIFSCINDDVFSSYLSSKLLFTTQMLLFSSKVRYPAISGVTSMLRMFCSVKLLLSKLPVIILCASFVSLDSGNFSIKAIFVKSSENTGGYNVASKTSDVYTILSSTTNE